MHNNILSWSNRFGDKNWFVKKNKIVARGKAVRFRILI